ncbi:uncharacterized protein LOC103310763 [Acyrthosiphon pisum]|uniref:Peptidase aspartic putative domain-containing protein n=1 Tax=Acyrthosiphon pisum TaxID=7029 RepID=A0A8R2FCF5_ACYPI|nr:uncharacterized protein LOC103310763 [Acyrthosiphon pisum]|eukprot:XP_008188283.1 PREDICTED: uncharacterized protein LOC103310763 [Acyrthosiphon pisum]
MVNALKMRRGQIRANKHTTIEEAWEEFQQVQSEIGDEEDENEHEQYQVDFEELYFKAMAKAEERLQQTEMKENSSINAQVEKEKTGVREISNAVPSIKLAALQIPAFSGLYSEWTPFYDIYTALVHDNKHLTTIEKFIHLRASLSGDAANCVKNLETTVNNYEHVWNSLVSRYNNKKLLVQTHVKGICDLPTVKASSSTGLRQFSDGLRGHISALRALDQRPSEWGPLLTHIICTKLDAVTISDWETKCGRDEIKKVDELIEFLEARFHILEAVESSKKICSVSKNVNENNSYTVFIENSSEANSKTEGEASALNTVTAHAFALGEQVLLATVVALAVSPYTKTTTYRALLDSGSQKNFITEEMVQTLRLKRDKIKHVISGIGEIVQHASSAVWLKIKSRVSDYAVFLPMIVVPKITGQLPPQNIKTTCNVPDNIKLADPHFNTPQKIDILLGATHFYEFLCDGQIRPSATGPLFQETVFGWVAAGSISENNLSKALAIERKLQKDKKLKEEYFSFMKEYPG